MIKDESKIQRAFYLFKLCRFGKQTAIPSRKAMKQYLSQKVVDDKLTNDEKDILKSYEQWEWTSTKKLAAKRSFDSAQRTAYNKKRPACQPNLGE